MKSFRTPFGAPRRLIAFLSLWLLIGAFLPQLALAADLAESIDLLLADPALKHGVSGVVVESLRDGRTLYSTNADKAFVPASNMKLFTSAAALDTLGADYRYKTEFLITGKITASALHGDIYIKGGGDPTLRTEHLEHFAQLLKQQGVRKVNGSIVGDEKLFGQASLGFAWSWDDEPWYYAAPFGALNLNRNAVHVYVKPGQTSGKSALVIVNPPTSYLTVKNSVTTIDKGSEASISIVKPYGRNIISVSGRVPLGYRKDGPEERISVSDPALYTTTSLTETLGRAGIQVSGSPRIGTTPTSAQLMHTRLSPPLSEILALLNKPSDNMIAETLFRTLGVERGKSASEEEARAAELAFLKKIGGDVASIEIADGSGLSRRNFISPSNIIAVLRYMNQSPVVKVYTDSLPIAGRDGTLRSRMKGTTAEGNVRAKTGYVSNVSSLSGYLTTAGGEPLVFSIMMNNHLCLNANAKAVQDKICELLCGLR